MTATEAARLVCIRMKDHRAPHVPSYADLCCSCYEAVWRSERSRDNGLEAICIQCAGADMLAHPDTATPAAYVYADLQERMRKARKRKAH